MTNYQIADHFALLGKLFDVHGENSFKAKSYSIAAFNIEQLPKQLIEMSVEEMYKSKGIGQSVGEKIQELLQNGSMSALQQIMDNTPAGVIQMLDIKGLGPKKINAVWKQLGIEDIGELEYACTENRLSALKGFGAKTQQTIYEAIGFYRSSQGYHLWAHVEELAAAVVTQLQNKFPDHRFALTGSIRRQDEVVDAIEIVTDLDQESLSRAYDAAPGVTFEAILDDRLTVRVPAQPAIRFYLSGVNDFYKNLFRFTASEEFNEAFLSSFTLSDTPGSETQIFIDNGLPFIPAPLRESATILKLAAEGKLPDLIQPGDIKGIIHSHSTWSDGQHSIEEMAHGAMALGYEYLVISDHSQAAFYAGGLTPAQIKEQHAEIDTLNGKLAPFRIFKSIEADILSDGSLDYGPEVLSKMDLVIASVHSNLKMTREKAMDRILAAIANPYTTILGHPTGRLLLSRAGYPVDHKVLIDACAQHNVVIEINAHPRRLDIDWRWVSYALEAGVLLSINPDAHSVTGYRDVYYGVMIGQKGGLSKDRNLSSFTLAQFEQFLKDNNLKRR